MSDSVLAGFAIFGMICLGSGSAFLLVYIVIVNTLIWEHNRDIKKLKDDLTSLYKEHSWIRLEISNLKQAANTKKFFGQKKGKKE